MRRKLGTDGIVRTSAVGAIETCVDLHAFGTCLGRDPRLPYAIHARTGLVTAGVV